MTKDEALRLALEALELHGKQYPHMVKGYCIDAITAIKAALEAKDEPVAWRDAAIRLGEELSSVGPDGYYDMDAKEWLDWAMEQNPRGEHSLPQRTWVGLTLEEILETYRGPDGSDYVDYARGIEAKLKEKKNG